MQWDIKPYWLAKHLENNSSQFQLKQYISDTKKSSYTIFQTAIAGIQFENRLSSIIKLSMNDFVFLKREPNNLHDTNAIAVYSMNSDLLGYVPAANAKKLSDYFRIEKKYIATIVMLQGSASFVTPVKVEIAFPVPIHIFDRNARPYCHFVADNGNSLLAIQCSSELLVEIVTCLQSNQITVIEQTVCLYPDPLIVSSLLCLTA